jgi:hypothetical protein
MVWQAYSLERSNSRDQLQSYLRIYGFSCVFGAPAKFCPLFLFLSSFRTNQEMPAVPYYLEYGVRVLLLRKRLVLAAKTRSCVNVSSDQCDRNGTCLLLCLPTTSSGGSRVGFWCFLSDCVV